MTDVTTPQEPQSAADYGDRTTAAVKSVLIEVGQVLGSFRGKFAIIGGAVPWLLLDTEEMPHGYEQRAGFRASTRVLRCCNQWRTAHRCRSGRLDAARSRHREE